MAPWGLTFLSRSEKMFTLIQSYSFDWLLFWLVLQISSLGAFSNSLQLKMCSPFI